MDPKTIKVWDVETRSGLQVIDGNYHPSLYSGVASIAFSSDSKTLIIVACDSTATFWKWTEDKPYLYGSKGMLYFCIALERQYHMIYPKKVLKHQILMANPPSITSRKVDQEEIIVFTWPNKLIYLHTIIITENVNIGMI